MLTLLSSISKLQQNEAESLYFRHRNVAISLIEDLMEDVKDPEIKRKIKEIL